MVYCKRYYTVYVAISVVCVHIKMIHLQKYRYGLSHYICVFYFQIYWFSQSHNGCISFSEIQIQCTIKATIGVFNLQKCYPSFSRQWCIFFRHISYGDRNITRLMTEKWVSISNTRHTMCTSCSTCQIRTQSKLLSSMSVMSFQLFIIILTRLSVREQ